MFNNSRLMKLFLTLILALVVGLAACGSDEDDSEDANGVNEDSTEEHESNDESEDEENEDNVAIPDEFPSDFPTLDNYTVMEAVAYGPESITGEFVEVKFKYKDTSKFSEAIDFYKDYYENGDFDVEYIVEHGELTLDEGAVEIKALTDEKANFCTITRLPNDDFFTVKVSIRNKVK